MDTTVRSSESVGILSVSDVTTYFNFKVFINILLEAEILASDSFQLGKDIEKFYELHQQLSMDDLARRKVMHTKVHLVRVLSKVIRNLEKPAELDTYLRCIGRLHQLAGVDSSYLSMSGKSFCDALDSIEQHKELWSKQVSPALPCGGKVFLVTFLFKLFWASYFFLTDQPRTL